jgi:hypothetical protein
MSVGWETEARVEREGVAGSELKREAKRQRIKEEMSQHQAMNECVRVFNQRRQ